MNRPPLAAALAYCRTQGWRANTIYGASCRAVIDEAVQRVLDEQPRATELARPGDLSDYELVEQIAALSAEQLRRRHER